MAKLIAKQGAIELSDDELDGKDPISDSLEIDCELSRPVCASVLVKKEKGRAPGRWPASLDGVKLVIPLSRKGARNARKGGKALKRAAVRDGKEFGIGALNTGDVVIWTVYGE